MQVRTHVADARTGRRHGRVTKVLAKDARYLVEWSDSTKSEHDDAELTARFTSQSKDYGKVF